MTSPTQVRVISKKAIQILECFVYKKLNTFTRTKKRKELFLCCECTKAQKKNKFLMQLLKCLREKLLNYFESIL